MNIDKIAKNAISSIPKYESTWEKGEIINRINNVITNTAAKAKNLNSELQNVTWMILHNTIDNLNLENQNISKLLKIEKEIKELADSLLK